MTIAVKHPAKFSEPLLPVMARYADGASTILDPFAGTGRVGLIRQHLTVSPVEIAANEIEEAWAPQGHANGCDDVWIGDARDMHWWEASRFDAIVTSPAYGNRMADACDWAPGRRHSTYTSALRETIGDPSAVLQAGNAGAEQWGHSYREIHRAAWREAWRVLAPGGRLVLNIADHYRAGVTQGVPEWHVSALMAIGFVLLDWCDVETDRYGFGANAELRCPELVIVMAKSGFDGGPAWRWWPDIEATNRWIERPAGTLWAVEPEPVQLSLLGGAS